MMEGTVNDDATIAWILRECRTIAVVGASSNPVRPSNRVAAYMKAQGYRVIPVNPNEVKVVGEAAYASLGSVAEPVDLVNIFRRSEEVLPIVDDAIAKGAKAVWMQEGVVNHAAAERAREAGLAVVMDRCWLKDHAAGRAHE
jgi:predicted CoA-binding protein